MRIRCSMSCRLWFQKRKLPGWWKASRLQPRLSKGTCSFKREICRDDFLVQIYVRDLLSMVMKNTASDGTKTDLPALYDELEAKIQALECLGRTQEKYGDFFKSFTGILSFRRNIRGLGEKQKYEGSASS
ncbi:hypothetical protein AVEN_181340-1 [Araneus ventricosus]|uniref:Uncharacterized protein n=1 Tax=Araneus ventricosus TaxID=182803 RepID=A0A4Y2UF14_ARAVE|nr:hypothetical protein AVEN_181340-1 [Araneus ventricosus]